MPARIDLANAGKTPESLTALLREHGSMQQVAEFGIWRAKSMMASDPDSRKALLAAGGAGVLVATLQSHMKQLAVQEDGCDALAELAGGGDSCRDALVAAGCLRVLVGAL
eukprot:1862651-Prymnesium_polylepis.1